MEATNLLLVAGEPHRMLKGKETLYFKEDERDWKKSIDPNGFHYVIGW